MAETPDEILKQIEAKRERLSHSIDELESYVREKADVKVHFLKNPWAFLGGAALTGLLLAFLVSPGSDHQRR